MNTLVAASHAFLVRFDGDVKRDRGVSIGFVGFDSLGALHFALGKFYDGIQDPFLAKLLALRDAMNWCLTRGSCLSNSLGIPNWWFSEFCLGIGSTRWEELC
ncbi:unnamed protein product [Linum trigynum]|uniref:Uncharacterized protein n=1 Tax=Linum trigynum TaxID=586398 RepID=A0AAV2FYX9_9ROSI